MPESKLYPAQLDQESHVLYCVVELNNNMFGVKKWEERKQEERKREKRKEIKEDDDSTSNYTMN